MAEDFGNALTRAVEAGGLSLERIRHHLARRGAQVSVSTVSYWRRGRSRLERPESLKVVKLLEEPVLAATRRNWVEPRWK